MSTKSTFVVVLADFGRGIQGIAGTARQKTRARVTANSIVASLGRKTIVFLRNTKVLESVKRIFIFERHINTIITRFSILSSSRDKNRYTIFKSKIVLRLKLSLLAIDTR